jgi:ABC-type multidrug transport system ATPase subunit
MVRKMFSSSLCSIVLFSLLNIIYGQQLSVTSDCSTPLGQLVYNLDPNGCGPTFQEVLVEAGQVTRCTTGVGGVNCMNPDSVWSMGTKSQAIVGVYRLPSPSSCLLCTDSEGMLPNCSSLLAVAVNAAYGFAPDYSTFGITNTTLIQQCDKLVLDASLHCPGQKNLLTLQVLQYQSELLCSSTNTFGMDVTKTSSGSMIQGIVDMRSLSSCGTCAVIPCLPGQLCDGSGKAVMCPEGFYCPLPAVQIKCPEDYFCPVGSTQPKKCRSIAMSSCSEGSTREVVWVPLLVACLFLIVVFYLELFFKILFYFYFTKRTTKPFQHHRLNPNEPQQQSQLTQQQQQQQQLSFSSTSSLVGIRFHHLMLVTNNTTRINDVSGRIRAGKFTAIIGGSGAGKTSLMNVILGREMKTSGEIAFLSKDYYQATKKIPAGLLDRIVAFVPQNDIYLREMTVYELIEHSARWRLPSFFTKEQIYRRIEEVLAQLQLEHLKDITVGGFSTQIYANQKSMNNNNSQSKKENGASSKRPTLRNAISSSASITLSPGDRKKVNIALELVANPNILFLDEPTTGIDSSSALNVAKIVSNLAKDTGITCVAVIHQPRTEIFSFLDDLIMLQGGGRVTYQGPTNYVIQYFEEHGFQLKDTKANKTDFLIDVISKPPPKQLFAKKSHNNHSNSQKDNQGERGGEEEEVSISFSAGSWKTLDQDESSDKGGTWADLWERDGLVSGLPSFLVIFLILFFSLSWPKWKNKTRMDNNWSKY